MTITGISNDEVSAAIYINGGNIAPKITNCTIKNNSTNYGSIYIQSGAKPIITNCLIIGNRSNSNGGGISVEGSNPIINKCTIINNTAQNSYTNNGNGGAIYFKFGGSMNAATIISNCTISGNKAKNGGGIYSNSSDPKIINCTIVNNTATDTSQSGHEVHSEGAGNPTFLNTLIWNTTDNAKTIYNFNNDIPISYCAYYNATNNNKNIGNIAFNTWENPVSSDVKVNGVTHKVYLAANNSVLSSLAGKGISSGDITSYDQLGNTRANPPAIGAIEIAAPVLSFDIAVNQTGSTLSTNYGTTKTLKFTAPNVTFGGAALSAGSYTITWSVNTSPAASTITIDQSGDLTVGSATAVGTYEATVKAKATYNNSGQEINSDFAEKKITITVNSSPITLGDITKAQASLPEGKVDTAYSATLSEYFSATIDPAGASVTWSVNGSLPGGLTCTNGVISGTPTTAGTFNFNVVATASATGYNTTSKDIAASIIIVNAGENLDMFLTLEKKSESSSLPEGRVSTEYSATISDYFTLTGAPDEASVTWSVNGSLPGGLSCTNGVISGTPTTAGTFNFNVVATASATGYNTTSKDISASITINSSSSGNDDGETITVPTGGGINDLSDTQKGTVKTLILNNVNDLSQIDSEVFKNLKTVQISSDTEVGNDGTLDLSVLPENIKKFSISGNTSLKNLNLKNSKVANIEAKNCTELTSVDVSGNENIVTLDVSSTNVKELNVSNCPKLTNVDCSGGVISKLDVSGCYALKEIKCEGNSLLALDIPSDLTNLESIDCSDQSLQDIKLPESFNFDVFVESPDMISENAVSASSVILAADTKLANVKNLQAFDANGKKIENTSDDSGNIIFASAPYSMTYDYDTGFKDKSTGEDTLMDVSINKTADSTESVVGGSGGGCDLIRNSEFGIYGFCF